MIVVGLIPAGALFVISRLGCTDFRPMGLGYAATVYFLLITIVSSCLCVRAPNDLGRRLS